MKKTSRMGALLIALCLLIAGCMGGGGALQEYSISGIITDASGNGVAGVTVVLSGGSSKTATTRADGTWDADGLKGRVTVTPRKDGWYFDPPSRTVDRANDQVNFTAKKTEPGGTVTVKIQFDHSFPKAREQQQYEPSSATISPRATTRNLPVSDPTTPHVPGEFVVMMDPSLSREERVRILEESGYVVLDTLDVIAAHLVTPAGPMPASAVEEEHHLAALQEVSGIWSVDYNHKKSLRGVKVPNDPDYSELQWWHYDQIRLPQAWSVTTGSRDIRIAVLDTGIDRDHPDLLANLDLEYAQDFSGDGYIDDTDGHGTHVAGTIGAVSNNKRDVAGVMWEVTILPIKVFPDGEDTEADDWMIANGILYASGLLNQPDKPKNPKPVDIINMSLGGPSSRLEQTAVEEAYSAGVILVAAAGNDGEPFLEYPAAYPEVIAVGATGSGRISSGRWGLPQRAYYSNYGDVDMLMAPGGGAENHDDGYVWSTAIDGEVWGMAGTSQATPHVSGVIGLMLANGIPKSEVRDVLERTAMKIGHPNEYGHGLINAYWAVNAVENVYIMQGRRNGDQLSPVQQKSVRLPAQDSYTMNLSTGSWQLMAWVDVNNNGKLDAGDYYCETSTMEFDKGNKTWTATLKEWKN